MPIEPERIQPLTLTTSDVTLTLSRDALLAIAATVSELLRPAAQPAGSPYMTVAEAADYIRSRPQRIYDLVSSQRLPKHKDGSRVLILRADLDRYLTGRGQPR